VRVIILRPREEVDCLCQFTPGQYLELWAADHPWMSRAYSIGNAPREDGSVELLLQHVPEGRFTGWAFREMGVGDVVAARGPLGTFTVRSSVDTPLVFVAGGTGFAPVKAMIEQQLRLVADRDLVLFWGARDARAFHALDDLAAWMRTDTRLRCILASEGGTAGGPSLPGITAVAGTVADAIRASAMDLAGRDAYVAGPPAMMRAVLDALATRGIERARIAVDAFGA
jgi:CDP-4-dehydro-6-deoxyglucose reductase